MLAVASVVIAVLVFLIIARVATVALTLTGLSRDVARFQARSALSGAGFTTNEAEAVVGHPVRRQIVMTLMLVGSAGLVTVIGSLGLTFVGTEGAQAGVRVLALVGALVLIAVLARSRWVDRALSKVIARVLERFTDLEARDYGAMLHLSERYAVGELFVREEDWVAGRALGELDLRDEGVVVLGVTVADGTWLGAPTEGVHLAAGDRVVAYGPGERLVELDRRRRGPDGDATHAQAVAGHREGVERRAREHGR
jgi:hypothetical protein